MLETLRDDQLSVVSCQLPGQSMRITPSYEDHGAAVTPEKIERELIRLVQDLTVVVRNLSRQQGAMDLRLVNLELGKEGD